jgi:hypothetical protein
MTNGQLKFHLGLITPQGGACSTLRVGSVNGKTKRFALCVAVFSLQKGR